MQKILARAYVRVFVRLLLCDFFLCALLPRCHLLALAGLIGGEGQHSHASIPPWCVWWQGGPCSRPCGRHGARGWGGVLICVRACVRALPFSACLLCWRVAPSCRAQEMSCDSLEKSREAFTKPFHSQCRRSSQYPGLHKLPSAIVCRIPGSCVGKLPDALPDDPWDRLSALCAL